MLVGTPQSPYSRGCQPLQRNPPPLLSPLHLLRSGWSWWSCSTKSCTGSTRSRQSRCSQCTFRQVAVHVALVGLPACAPPWRLGGLCARARCAAVQLELQPQQGGEAWCLIKPPVPTACAGGALRAQDAAEPAGQLLAGGPAAPGRLPHPGPGAALCQARALQAGVRGDAGDYRRAQPAHGGRTGAALRAGVPLLQVDCALSLCITAGKQQRAALCCAFSLVCRCCPTGTCTARRRCSSWRRRGAAGSPAHALVRQLRHAGLSCSVNVPVRGWAGRRCFGADWPGGGAALLGVACHVV